MKFLKMKTYLVFKRKQEINVAILRYIEETYHDIRFHSHCCRFHGEIPILSIFSWWAIILITMIWK